MLFPNRSAKTNIRALIILIVVTIALGVSLFFARQIRRSILSKADLQAGTAAFENSDWEAAYRHFEEYLGRNPDDVEILRKYAQAQLSMQPLDASALTSVVAAYRRVIQLAPLDQTAYDKLAMIYTGIGESDELAYIARQRLEHVPSDQKAPLWLAEALIQLNKTEEARQILQAYTYEVEKLPDKHAEYVRACALMSQVIRADISAGAKARSLEWLNKAVDHAPESVEALVSRAQFYRETPDIPGVSEKDGVAAARRDLEAADALGTDNPKSRYALGAEWMAHGELDRAAAELQAAESLSQETLKEQFLDLNDWTVAKFQLASQLMMRQRAVAAGASLADKTLAELKETRHRIQVLPSATMVYIAAGKVSEARRCLDEYLDTLYTQKRAAESKQRLANLQALVAKAEDNWYAVIDVLQPTVVTDTSRPDLWRLLAEAFSRTDQPRRAVSALVQYLRHYPDDSQMTVQLAREYVKLRDWKKAFDAARLAEALNPADVDLRLLRIEASINLADRQQESNTADLEELSGELVTLRADYPGRVDIRILQALIATSLGHPDGAENELKLAIGECEEPLSAEMQLVKHYHRAKQMTEAIRVCQTACGRHSEVAEPWLYLSDLYAANADYDSARSSLRQGLNTVAGKWETRSISLKLALLELTHGDRDTGIRLLTRLATEDKREIYARTLLLSTREIQEKQAAAQELVGELREAEGESGLMWRLHQASVWLSSEEWRSKQQDVTDLLQYCINSDPNWSSPVLLLAGMYEKLNELSRVEDVCRHALIRNPSATDIADRLMTLLEKQGRFSDAEQVLRQTEADPRVASAWQVRMAVQRGDFSRAIDELKLKVSNDDQDASSRILLARLIYWQTKDVDQAFAYLKEAEAITSNSTALTAAKASILRVEGRAEEVQRILDEHVESRSDFGAYVMRAAYLAQEGETDRAEADYRKLTTFAENGATGYALLSDFYAQNGKLDQAVTTLDEGLRRHSEDLGLKRRLMKTLLLRANAQDRQRALEILASLEEKMPQDPGLMKLRALHMLQEPTPQSRTMARETLENVIRLEPTAVDAHLVLIDMAVQEGQYKDARDSAIRALGANPNNLALLSARARVELALANTQMAIQLAHLVLREDPNNAEARDIIVATAQKSKDRALLEQARTLIESALGDDPQDEQLLLSRAHVSVSLKQPQTAIPELEAYCQTQEGSRSIAALVTLSDLYRLSGDAEKARQRIEQAENIDPNSQMTVHARFLWLMSQHRFEELAGISPAYLSAEEQDPATLLAAASILAASDSMALRKEGLRLFEHVAAVSPTLVDARLGLASALYQTGNTERAKEIYQKLLDQYPDNTQALNDLAWILQEHDHAYTAALQLANRGLSLSPKDPHLLDTRGTILSNMAGRFAEAKTDFERLVELSPSETARRARALLKLGRIHVRLNNLVEAKQQFEKALVIDRKTDALTADERLEIETIVQASGK